MTKIPKVLLIDDDPDFVEATRIVLESKPYEVIVSYDGDDGLRKAKKESPDLIILDVIMPVKDGFSTAEQLKKDAGLKNIPVIMLTARHYLEDESETANYSHLFDDYVVKPFVVRDLMGKINRLLNRHYID